jgi:hypothetical protein
MRALLIAIALAAGLAGAAHAAGTKSVKDWAAVCDNLGGCAAFGFSAEETDTDAFIRIQREAGPAAAPVVTIVYDTAATEPAQTWSLALDGHPVAGVGLLRATGSENGARASLSGPAAGALIAALRNGQALSLNQGGKALIDISLAGSAAILLWVDDQQRRIDTVTALVRRGPKPASAVPGASAAPLIPAAPPAAQGGLPQHTPKRLVRDVVDCDLTGVTEPDDIIARLAPGVVLWGPQCQMGAYNEVSIFYVGDEKAQHLRRISLPEAPGAGQASDDMLFNANFDPKTQTLASFSKGRGIGDCGAITTWVWDGKAFELLSELNMPVCRGVVSDDWPPLFVGRRK